MSSFSLYEAAFFQCLLFDQMCLSKACHNLRRMFNLSMYITNIVPHGKCSVRCLHTHCFVSEISLVRFLIRHNSCVNTRAVSMKYSIHPTPGSAALFGACLLIWTPIARLLVIFVATCLRRREITTMSSNV